MQMNCVCTIELKKNAAFIHYILWKKNHFQTLCTFHLFLLQKKQQLNIEAILPIKNLFA